MTEILIYRALIDSNVSHDELVSISHLVKEQNDLKNAIKSPKIFDKESIIMWLT